MTATSLSNPNHASNALSRGDCRDLESAVATLLDAIAYDRAWDATYGGDLADPPSPSYAKMLDDLEQQALAAQLLYRHCRETGRDPVTELRHVGLKDWADALETSDFSRFAI